MKTKWVRKEQKYSTGEHLRVGRVNVGSYFNATRSRGEPQMYAVEILLPGIRLKEPAKFATIEEAKKRLENAVYVWFKWIEEDIEDA